jgi:hypothetical protein
MITDTIYAFGHPNITCTHDTTIELTKDQSLTLKGNCILGLYSSKSCRDLTNKTKNLIQKGKKFKITVISDELNDYFFGYGHKDLTLTNQTDLVFRKSNYICDRTVLINCTKSALELKRELIKKIKIRGTKVIIDIELCE